VLSMPKPLPKTERGLLREIEGVQRFLNALQRKRTFADPVWAREMERYYKSRLAALNHALDLLRIEANVKS